MSRLVRSRGARALVATLLVLVVGAGATLAGDPNAGRHHLRDTLVRPGATCRYEGHHLTEIDVRPPVMYAKDRTGGNDSQSVAWTFTIQVDLDNDPGTWYSGWNADSQRATATDATPASLKKLALHLPPHAGYFHVRVQVVMYWLYPTKWVIDARVTTLVAHYRVGTLVRGSCLDYRP